MRKLVIDEEDKQGDSKVVQVEEKEAEFQWEG
jgi:hypothetical protein